MSAILEAMETLRKAQEEFIRRVGPMFPLEAAVKLEFTKVAGEPPSVQNLVMQFRPAQPKRSTM